MGLGNLFGKNVETEKRFSFNRLYEMANFSKEWIKASNQLKKISSESSRLAEQLDQFVEKHKLSASSVGTRSKEKINYQPLLDELVTDTGRPVRLLGLGVRFRSDESPVMQLRLFE